MDLDRLEALGNESSASSLTFIPCLLLVVSSENWWREGRRVGCLAPIESAGATRQLLMLRELEGYLKATLSGFGYIPSRSCGSESFPGRYRYLEYDGQTSNFMLFYHLFAYKSLFSYSNVGGDHIYLDQVKDASSRSLGLDPYFELWYYIVHVGLARSEGSNGGLISNRCYREIVQLEY